MPCNLVAVRTAKAVVDPRLVLDNPQMIEGVKTLVAQIVGVKPEHITAYNDKQGTAWWQGWDQWRQNHTITETIPAEKLVGGAYVDWVCDQCAVRLERDGTLTFRDGWDLPASKHFTPEQADAILTQLNAAFNQLLGVLFQQKVQQIVASQFALQNAQYAANGALVLTVEV